MAASFPAACWQLCKPRLALFSLLSAMAAYGMVPGAPGGLPLLLSFLGIGLSAAGTLSFNQWWEWRSDARMHRTRSRPLPAGVITPTSALVVSLALALTGMAVLATSVSVLSGALAALVFAIYGLIYTPLKKHSRWATEVGSVSGALPPLLGAAAAGDLAHPGPWVLFAVLLFWQMPHFYGIGWEHREDYRRAGYRLLPNTDLAGDKLARWCLLYSLPLVALPLVPPVLFEGGLVFAAVALPAGVWLVLRAMDFHRQRSRRDLASRRLFLASLVYLPPVMLALVIDQFLAG